MATAKLGDTVRVHYTGTTEGEKFDSSHDRNEPLEFTIGASQVIPGFENGVLGLSPGESKTVDIPASMAYGPHNPDMVMEEQLSNLPPGVELGATLVGQDSSGQQVRFDIVEIRGDVVVLDGNHPLAGKKLTFDLELVEIIPDEQS